ncbi:MAG: hypothetical protein AB7O59_06675 [Pirellulales bacterium]
MIDAAEHRRARRFRQGRQRRKDDFEVRGPRFRNPLRLAEKVANRASVLVVRWARDELRLAAILMRPLARGQAQLRAGFVVVVSTRVRVMASMLGGIASGVVRVRLVSMRRMPGKAVMRAGHRRRTAMISVPDEAVQRLAKQRNAAKKGRQSCRQGPTRKGSS